MCLQSAPWTFCFPSGLTSVYEFWNSLGKSVLNGTLRERIIGLGTKRGSDGRKRRSKLKELRWWRRWALWTGPLAPHQAHYPSLTVHSRIKGACLRVRVCVCKTYLKNAPSEDQIWRKILNLFLCVSGRLNSGKCYCTFQQTKQTRGIVLAPERHLLYVSYSSTPFSQGSVNVNSTNSDLT